MKQHHEEKSLPICSPCRRRESQHKTSKQIDRNMVEPCSSTPTPLRLKIALSKPEFPSRAAGNHTEPKSSVKQQHQVQDQDTMKSLSFPQLGAKNSSFTALSHRSFIGSALQHDLETSVSSAPSILSKALVVLFRICDFLHSRHAYSIR